MDGVAHVSWQIFMVWQLCSLVFGMCGTQAVCLCLSLPHAVEGKAKPSEIDMIWVSVVQIIGHTSVHLIGSFARHATLVELIWCCVSIDVTSSAITCATTSL